jgi:LPS-assembly protein
MRTDLGAAANVGPVDMSLNYVELAPDAVSRDFTTTSTTTTTPTTTTPTTTTPTTNQQRQQEIVGKGALSLTDTWALLGTLRYDLENAQTISDGVGIRYQDDCLTLAVTYEQTNIQDQDIQPEQRVMVNLALKYLGTYQFQTDAFGAFGPEVSNTSD